MEMLSGAEMVVRTLEDLGVDRLFGYPGGAVLDIYDALKDSKKIHHVLVRHEQSAAHAADGYARTTGRVGCCLVTSGPGATNTITGIATAYMDSVPMVIITGQVATFLIGQDAFQEVDMVGISRPIVKHSYICKKAEDIPVFIRKAFHIASTGRPGPVVVDIPKDCQNPKNKFPYEPKPLSEITMRSYNPTRFGHKGQIRRSLSLLAEAKKPVIHIGGGVIASEGACAKVTEFARRYHIPVTSTLMGLGAYPGTDPQFLGMVGMHGTYAANTAMHESDLIIALGARFSDRSTNNVDKYCPKARIVHVDIDPSSIAKRIKVDIPVVADIGTALDQMNDVIREMNLSMDNARLDPWWTEIEAMKTRHPVTCAGDGTPGLLHPGKVVEDIYRITDGKAIVVTDVGQHQMFTALYYKFDTPRKFLSSGGLGTMGYGFPAAVGAKIASPESEVICITGDGSFQMNLQELATCLQYGIAVKIVILNNVSLGMVKQWQMMFYNGRQTETFMDAAPDFVKLAECYGQVGIRAGNPDELNAALKKALDIKDKTVVIDVQVDPDSRVYPMQIGGGSMGDMRINRDEEERV